MMLYHNMNSDHKRVARNILVEQAKNDPKSTNSTTDNLTNRTKKNVENMSKSKWIKHVKKNRIVN